MKNIRYILAGLIVFMMQVSLANTEVLSDNEIKQKIIRFIAPVCAESMIDGELIDTYYINGNTNRLLRILSDMVKTNDEWICTQTMFEYSKYATKLELPFLYSCATNSMCGDRALNTIISIDGIYSNLLQTAGQYFSITNGFSVDDDANRSRFAEDLIRFRVRRRNQVGYLNKNVVYCHSYFCGQFL